MSTTCSIFVTVLSAKLQVINILVQQLKLLQAANNRGKFREIIVETICHLKMASNCSVY